jgi:hypothetical protein
MSLFKARGKETPAFTLLDKTEAKLEEIIVQKREANIRVREKMMKLFEERTALKKEHDELEGRIQKLTSEYTEALEERRAEKVKQIEEASVTEEDLKAGRVNVNEFFAVGKRKADIEKESRLAAETKMDKVRGVIRSLSAERYGIVKKLCECEEKISRSYSELAVNFRFQLKAMQEGLEEAGIGNMRLSTAHFKRQEAENDWTMATKGAILHHGKQWKVKSFEEAELIALDPILQERHFEDFRKFLDSIRGLEFSEMNVNYNPSDSAGRAAGEFWMDYRAKVSER